MVTSDLELLSQLCIGRTGSLPQGHLGQVGDAFLLLTMLGIDMDSGELKEMVISIIVLLTSMPGLAEVYPLE